MLNTDREHIYMKVSNPCLHFAISFVIHMLKKSFVAKWIIRKYLEKYEEKSKIFGKPAVSSPGKMQI